MGFFLITSPGESDTYREVPVGIDAPSLQDMGIDPATAIEVPRLPERWESWDQDAGDYVLDVASIDAELLATVDAEAGDFRKRFITTVPGQELTYLRKEEEARRFLANGGGAFPMLEAQAAATGKSVADLAAEVVSRANAWITLGAAIEAARMGAKQAVVGASTREAKLAAAIVEWAALTTPDKPMLPMGGKAEGKSQ